MANIRQSLHVSSVAMNKHHSGYLPEFVLITEGSCHDVKQLLVTTYLFSNSFKLKDLKSPLEYPAFELRGFVD